MQPDRKASTSSFHVVAAAAAAAAINSFKEDQLCVCVRERERVSSHSKERKER